MRKVKISVILIFLFFLIYNSRYLTGVYFNFNSNLPVSSHVRTEADSILIYDDVDKEFKEFIVRGVELGSGLPGARAIDYSLNKKDYLRWLKYIGEMGANTIRISTIFDDDFYNAFYEYNSENKEKIYLLQGVSVSDYANNSGNDAYSKDFINSLEKDSLKAVDVIHGKRDLYTSKRNGSGRYRKDVSPWVLGYVIGNEWNPGTMAYTNHNKNYKKEYQGQYFFTDGESTVFEAMLAEIMDGVMAYESKKYGSQRLISFFNDQQNDPFEYEKHYGKQLNKYNYLDFERIKPTERVIGGYFASYKLDNFVEDFSQYLSGEEKSRLAEELKNLDKDLIHDGYPQLLANYHSMPVLILSDGFSTSRGTDEADGPMTEEEQGEALLSSYRDIISSGCKGGIISKWQDSWEASYWNTSYSVNFHEKIYWRDVQTKALGYGLLSFEAGDGKTMTYVDGDASEWSVRDRILENEDNSLSLSYDEAYMYFLVERKDLSKDDSLYIGLDISPNSGSKLSKKPDLKFDRPMDFIIEISGKNSSKILVNERYNSLRQNYLMEIEARDPFTSVPEKDSSSFLPIYTISSFNKMIEEDLEPEVIKEMKLLDTFETGKLLYGNANPNSRDYNSLADFYFGENIVEIRIPWQLLNFSNPSQMKIHDDYYKNYGVEEITLDDLYIGISGSNSQDEIKTTAVKLKSWGNNPNYHERLKKSYNILKEEWGK